MSRKMRTRWKLQHWRKKELKSLPTGKGRSNDERDQKRLLESNEPLETQAGADEGKDGVMSCFGNVSLTIMI